ncbi:MAG TPA: hypothetical protein VGB73_07415 [Pyrinomonadaceae bacterium]
MNKRALFLLLYFVAAAFVVTRAQTENPSVTRPRRVAAPSATVAQAVQQPSPTSKAAPAQPQTTAPQPAPATTTPSAPLSAPPVTSTLPAPQGSTGGPLSVPTLAPYAQAAPLQPARPIAPNKARARIVEAQRLMQTRLTPTASMMPSLYMVTVAALDQDSSQIHLMSIPKQTLLTRGADVALVTSRGQSVRLRIVRPNYVNTSVVVSDAATGRQLTPLLIEYPIEKGGIYREMAYYTSAHPALMSPELVKTGQNYVRTMVDLAAQRLKDKGIHIAPQLLDIAERLCIVEHVDHGRFMQEARLSIYEEIYALYALNELNTYRYSVSTAGAGGMVQMIPWTYQMIRQRHAAVGLNPDFVAGMRNHGNALEAMLLYINDTWRDLLLNPDVAYAFNSGLATQSELVSAGYNSNPARLGGYIRRGGNSWRYLIPRETQMYLQIYKSFDSLMPLKLRAPLATPATTTTLPTPTG